LEYVPFGETFIDERRSASSWTTPYLFSGKERDEETGLLYFGARYQDSKYGIWYSVDPLAEIRPWESAYLYCGNNPINRTDPTGLKWEDKNKAIALKANADSEIKARQQSIKDDQEKLKDSNISEEQKQQYNNNINSSTERITWLEGSNSDIDKLEADQDHTFILNDAGGGYSGNVTQNSDKKISINAPTNALAFHEIKHVSQSIKSGKLTFVNGKLQNPGTTNREKGNIELAAYKAQFAFKGAIPGGENLKKPSEVTYDLVSKMTNDKGKLLYPFMSKDKK
jgi:RHS repeat-associated protein